MAEPVLSSESAPPVKSSKDIIFPTIDRIMGLPPIGAETDGEYFDTKSFLEATFPILHITAAYCEWEDTTKPMSPKKLSQEYHFAVIPDSTIAYTHTNNYYASNIEQDLANLIRLNTAGEVRQLAMVSKGASGQAFTGVGVAYLDEIINQLTDVLQTYGGRVGGDTGRLFAALGGDVSRTFLGGGRIDIPNIWEDSNTGMSWTFTIDLRTMATNPNSELYIRDIIQPLEVLLKLALPVGGYNISYLEPPYISARLGNIMDVKLGGISNLSWSAPMVEMNFNEVPRHIEVSLTIQDLYNVMVQSGSENPDFPTAERFINNFSRNYNNRTGGKIYSNVLRKEYDFNMGSSAEAASEVSSSMVQPRYSSITQPAIPNAQVSRFNVKKLMDNIKTSRIVSSFDRALRSLSVKTEYTNTVFKLDNVKNIMGSAVNYNFANGQPITLDLNSMNRFDVSGKNILQDLSFPGLDSDILSSFQNVFNNNTMLYFTDNSFSQVPNASLDSLASVQNILMGQLGGFINESGDNIGILLSSTDNIIKVLPLKIPSILSGETVSSEAILSAALQRIRNYDIVLDNQIKYSPETQRYLHRASDIFADRFCNNEDVITEIRAIGSGLDLNEYVGGMSNVFSTASVIMNSSSLNSILSPQLSGVDNDLTIVMGGM